MRILITGSRSWDDPDTIKAALLAEADPAEYRGPVTLVSGGCPRGADALAEMMGFQLGWTVEIHPANWERHGKRAGFIRNADMVNRGANVCLAFIRDGSKGASMTARLAEKAGIPTKIFLA